MGWHDTSIHAITFAPEQHEFILDLDYIFAWVEPEAPSPGYSFWISPATLVFKDVRNFSANLGDPLGPLIMHVAREEQTGSDSLEWSWTMDLLHGKVTFSASGYIQYTRKLPIKCQSQELSLAERGGISFDRPSTLLVQ